MLTLLAGITAAFAVALLGTRLASRARAATRHLMLASAFGIALLLPIASLVSPKITVEIPALPAHDAEPAVATPVALPTAAPVESSSADEAPVPAERTLTQVKPARTIPPATWLLMAWAVVALAALIPVAAGLWHLRRIRRDGKPWPTGAARLRQLLHPATRIPAVLLSDAIAAPITGGLFRPVIALPAGATGWSEAHLANALLHEMEHVRRHDWLVQLAARMVCALYWIHPLAWIAWRRLRLEAERACDDAVLAREDATDYAEQLLGLARSLKDGPAQPGIPMAGGSDLSARIRSVLDSTLPRGRTGRFVLAGIALVAVIAIGVLASVRATGPTRAAAGSVAIDDVQLAQQPVDASTRSMGPNPAAPACTPEPGRAAEEFHGSLKHGESFVQASPSGWIFKLVPQRPDEYDYGWIIEVSAVGRENDDLAGFTLPLHGAVRPVYVFGWHFRNADNTGPNDGSVNADGELREFIFSPAVGREVQYIGGRVGSEGIEQVSSFGRGWLFIDAYQLTPPQQGTMASFESLQFRACLTWPADASPNATTPDEALSTTVSAMVDPANVAFGYTDDTGTKLLSLADMNNATISDELANRLVTAVCAEGQVLPVRYRGRQQPSTAGNGRQSSYNFANEGGQLYDIEGHAEPDDTCMLVPSEYVAAFPVSPNQFPKSERDRQVSAYWQALGAAERQQRPLDLKSLSAPTGFSKQSLAALEKARSRPVSLYWLLYRNGPQREIAAVEFAPDGDDLLGALVLVEPGRLSFMDMPASLKKGQADGCWRVDDDCRFGAASMNVQAVLGDPKRQLVFVTMYGAEGAVILLLQANDGKLVELKRAYRYQAPI